MNKSAGKTLDFLKVVRMVFWSGVVGPGACFSKVPVTLRARNQIFKSKYQEWERGSWLADYSILFH